MHNEQQNTILAAIAGDYNIHIIETGFSEDVDSMIVGWIHTWDSNSNNPARITGITWDQARILIDASQPLQARECMALMDAGFMVDEAFMP